MRPDSLTEGEFQPPAQLREATKERGQIVGWAPQGEVLEHPDVGGLLIRVSNVLGWVKRLRVKRVTGEKHVNPYTTRLING